MALVWIIFAEVQRVHAADFFAHRKGVRSPACFVPEIGEPKQKVPTVSRSSIECVEIDHVNVTLVLLLVRVASVKAINLAGHTRRKGFRRADTKKQLIQKGRFLGIIVLMQRS